jgi:type IV secretory pathway TrbD component
MGARTKLNRAFFNGSLLLAAAVGLVTNSWLVFGFVLVILLALNLLSGEIRPRRGRRR